MASNGAIPPPIADVADEAKFDGGVKTSWSTVKRKILSTLKGQGLVGYVDGTIGRPLRPDIQEQINQLDLPATTSPQIYPPVSSQPAPTPVYSLKPSYEEWKFRNDRAKTIIEAHLEDVLSLVPNIDDLSAFQVMVQLNNDFDKKNDLLKIDTNRRLRTFRYNEIDTLEEFFKDIRELRKKAIEAGNTYPDDEYRSIILSAFPTEAFDPIINNITTSSNYPTSAAVIQQISYAYGRIAERKGAVSSGAGMTPITPAAHAAVVARVEELEKQLALQTMRDVKKCHNCGKRGHFKRDCWEPGGGKEGQRPQRTNRNNGTSTTVSPAANVTQTSTIADPNAVHFALAIMEPGSEGRKRVYADSAATDHFFTRREDFMTYTPYESTGQSSEERTQFRIVGKGKAVKRVMVDGKEVILTFEEAYHAPNATHDLISIPVLDLKGCNIRFGGRRAEFYTPDGKLFLTGKLETERLYRIEESPHSASAVARSLVQPTTLKEWHRRFGHAGEDRIVVASKLVDGLDITEFERDGRCVPCVHGKGTRRPFDAIVTPETRVLERVHTDLTGPIRVTSKGGYKYSMPVVDGATSFTKDYYLKNKEADTVLEALEIFRAWAERQTGEMLKEIRVDGGGEFNNKVLESWSKKLGIEVIPTAPHSSAMNGVAERKHRSIFDGVRTVLNEARLPAYLWAYAAAYIVHTNNLLPSARHPKKIPAEAFTGKRQNVEHLRPFGSRGFAKVVDGSLGKLDSRVVEGKMIGYGGHGTYLLYTASGKVITSRDVTWVDVARTSATVGGESEEVDVWDVGELLPTVGDAEGQSCEDGGQSGDQNTEDAVSSVTPNGNQPDTPQPPIPHRPDSPQIPTSIDTPLLPAAINPESDNDSFKPAPPVPIPVRRSARLKVPSRTKVESNEFIAREKTARQAKEQWTRDHKPRANLAFTDFLDDFNDIGDPRALAALGIETTPKSYKQAMEKPDVWGPAIQDELNRMEEFGVFGPVQDLPFGKKALKPLWVFANKLDGDGNIVKRKARLVIDGRRQIEGVDFTETYAGTLRFESLRILLALWTSLNYHIWQVDFSSAYLNAGLDEETYIWVPEGHEGAGSGKVIRLLKSVYGMCQAGHNWFVTLDKAYQEWGWKRSDADQCVRSRVRESGETMTGTYTDDTLGGSSSLEEAYRVKEEIGGRFKIKATDDVQFAIGMRLINNREQGTISLDMAAYFDRIFTKFGVNDMKPKPTPFPPGLVLSKSQCPSTDEEREFMHDKPYAILVGAIQFAQAACRPDITYAVNVLSRYLTNPGKAHWNALVHLVRYISGTKSLGIKYSRAASRIPITYADADYGTCVDTRKSTTGVVTIISGGPVFWVSKRQDVVATSTTEAEYIALGRAAMQAKWTHDFLSEVGHPAPLPSQVRGDNKSSLALAENPKFNGRVKHMEIRFHFLRDEVEKGNIQLDYIASEVNPADVLTKSLTPTIFRRQLDLMGLMYV